MQVFGNNMLLLILVSLIQLIWRAYFVTARLYDGDPDKASLTHRRNIRSALLCLCFIRRLTFLTSHVHELDKQVISSLASSATSSCC